MAIVRLLEIKPILSQWLLEYANHSKESATNEKATDIYFSIFASPSKALGQHIVSFRLYV